MLYRLFPRFCVPTGLSVSNISRDPSIVQAFEKDPLRQSNVSLQTGNLWHFILAQSCLGNEIFRCGEWIRDLNKPKIHTNVMISHGNADRHTSFTESKHFFEALSIPTGCQKSSKWIDGGFHERTLSYASISD